MMIIFLSRVYVLFILLLHCSGEWLPRIVPFSQSTYVASTFLSDSTVISLGFSTLRSVIVRSTDNGLSWSGYTLTGVSFAFCLAAQSLSSGNVAMTVDWNGNVFTSYNSGLSFSKANVGSLNFEISCCTIGRNGNAFVAGQANLVFRSSDASRFATWVDKSPNEAGESLAIEKLQPKFNVWD